LYLALLHAVTHRPLRRDALTDQTGLEAALNLLSTARVWSAAPRTAEEMRVLRCLDALAPTREFYPAHLEMMERVAWPNPHVACAELDLLALKVRWLLDESGRVAPLHAQASHTHAVELRSNDNARLRLSGDACTRAASQVGPRFLDDKLCRQVRSEARQAKIMVDAAVYEFVRDVSAAVRIDAVGRLASACPCSFDTAMRTTLGNETSRDISLDNAAWPRLSHVWRQLYAIAKEGQVETVLAVLTACRAQGDKALICMPLLCVSMRSALFPDVPNAFVVEEAFVSNFDEPRIRAFTMLPKIEVWIPEPRVKSGGHTLRYDWAAYWSTCYQAWEWQSPRPRWDSHIFGQDFAVHASQVDDVVRRAESLWSHRRALAIFFAQVDEVLRALRTQ